MDTDLRDTHLLGRSTYQRLVTGQTCPGLAGIGLLACGLSLCDQAFTICEGRPDTALLLFVLDREGEVLVEGAWRRVGPGTCYQTPPGLRRAYRAMQPGWHIGWAAWLPGKIPAGLAEVPAIAQGQPEACSEAIRQLWRECTGAREPLVVAHLLPLVQIYLARLLGADGPERRLDRLWQEVDADPAGDWNARSLARRVGIGPEQLRRWCRSAYQQSPVQRVRRLRLERAAALLDATGMSVAAVAAAVGYGDPESFATAFRRQHRTSPLAYRRRGV